MRAHPAHRAGTRPATPSGRPAALLSAALLALLVAGPAAAQLDMPRTSQAASVTQTIGVTEVTIRYHRPGVKGRTIWGGLVPYDKVWRAGANDRTTFTATDDVMIEGKPLSAGTYGLMMIPGARSWTIIFSKVADSWGAFDYSQDNDALRVEVTPHEAPRHEWLEYGFENLADDSADAVLRWDRLAVPFHVSVDLDARVMANLDAVVRWQYPYRAATYALESGKHLDQAMHWVEASLALERNFWNLAAKARLLAATGDHAQAIEVGQEALKAAEGMEQPPQAPYLQALRDEIDGWRDEPAH